MVKNQIFVQISPAWGTSAKTKSFHFVCCTQPCLRRPLEQQLIEWTSTKQRAKISAVVVMRGKKTRPLHLRFEDFKGFRKKMKLEFVSYIGLEWFGYVALCSHKCDWTKTACNYKSCSVFPAVQCHRLPPPLSAQVGKKAKAGLFLCFFYGSPLGLGMPSQFLAARQGCSAANGEATWLQFIEHFKTISIFAIFHFFQIPLPFLGGNRPEDPTMTAYLLGEWESKTAPPFDRSSSWACSRCHGKEQFRCCGLLPNYLSIYLPIYLSIYRSIYLPFYLSIYLSIT